MPYVGALPPLDLSVEGGRPEGVTTGVTGTGALLGAAGRVAGVRAAAGRAAAFRAGFLETAFLAGFLDAFLALDFFPDALRAVFLRLEALRFAFFLATVVPP
jgi:hypothetical protein